MGKAALEAALAIAVGDKLAMELVTDLMKMRQDYATNTLERAAPGKFVETFVQCLQKMAQGEYDAAPSVDHYLDKVAPNQNLPESLRITAARIARSIYTIRNKRNVAHKGELDPNLIDLAYAHSAGVWITAELVRVSASVSMEEAARLVSLLHTPVGALVEEIEGVRLVHADVSVVFEVLILMHSHYPDPLSLPAIQNSLSRRAPRSVANRVREMALEKLLQGTSKTSYHLTSAGHKKAVEVIHGLTEAEAA